MMRPVLMLIFALLTLTPRPLPAAAYKCTDATGKVSYQQQPCAGRAKQETTRLSAFSSWIRLRSEPFGNGQNEVFLDTGSIRHIGVLKRAAFKDVLTRPEGPKESLSTVMPYYHYYDCNAGSASWISTDDSKAAEFEEMLIHNKKELLFSYEKLKTLYKLRHGDADIVAKICGN